MSGEQGDRGREMLTVEQHAAIRAAYHTDQKSIRMIAQELNVSRQSVRKALATPTAPRYMLRTPRAAPKLDTFRARILALLATQATQPRKQRYTGVTIYRTLVAEGYQGSESRLRAYIGVLKRQQTPPPTFLPLQFAAGHDAQMDWGEATVVLAGVPVTVQLCVLRLCYSRRTFAMAFPTQRQDAFFAGHMAAFAFFGGVPPRITYDNLTVAQRLRPSSQPRSEQRAFVAFRSYYLFASHFCTPGEPHEKGQIEHAVGYVRRHALVPVPHVPTYAALNAHLLAWCVAQDTRTVHGHAATIGAQWAAEQPHLRPLPTAPFPGGVTTTVTLTPYSQVVFETNRYSVPTDQARRHLTMRASPFHVTILADDQIIAEHLRSYAQHQDVCDPLHYLPLLAQRPGALPYAKPFIDWQTRWPASYTRLLDRLRQQWPDGRGVREFVTILQLHTQHPAADVAAAIGDALTFGCVHADGVRLCLYQRQHPDTPTVPLDLQTRPSLAAVRPPPVDLMMYDQLLTGGTP